MEKRCLETILFQDKFSFKWIFSQFFKSVLNGFKIRISLFLECK